MTKQERNRIIKGLIKDLLEELDNKGKDELIGVLEGILFRIRIRGNIEK